MLLYYVSLFKLGGGLISGYLIAPDKEDEFIFYFSFVFYDGGTFRMLLVLVALLEY